MLENLSSTFFICIAIGVFLMAFTIVMVKINYRRTSDAKFSVDLFKMPTSFSMQALGIVVPILIALASYIYLNSPEQTFQFLLASISIYSFVFVLATWSSFTLPNVSVDIADNTIKLEAGKSNHMALIHVRGLMYILLLYGFILLMLFFLQELKSKPNRQVDPLTIEHSAALLKRPLVSIGYTKNKVIESWGAPLKVNNENEWQYTVNNIHIIMHFSHDGTIIKIEKL